MFQNSFFDLTVISLNRQFVTVYTFLKVKMQQPPVGGWLDSNIDHPYWV